MLSFISRFINEFFISFLVFSLKIQISENFLFHGKKTISDYSIFFLFNPFYLTQFFRKTINDNILKIIDFIIMQLNIVKM